MKAGQTPPRKPQETRTRPMPLFFPNMMPHRGDVPAVTAHCKPAALQGRLVAAGSGDTPQGTSLQSAMLPLHWGMAGPVGPAHREPASAAGGTADGVEVEREERRDVPNAALTRRNSRGSSSHMPLDSRISAQSRGRDWADHAGSGNSAVSNLWAAAHGHLVMRRERPSAQLASDSTHSK